MLAQLPFLAECNKDYTLLHSRLLTANAVIRQNLTANMFFFGNELYSYWFLVLFHDKLFMTHDYDGVPIPIACRLIIWYIVYI